MSWKRNSIEALVAAASKLGPKLKPPSNPSSIFVLRNNDLGDLLVITPLFEALKRRFPASRIVAGIGAWGVEILQGNPFVDEIMVLNAPWHNKFIVPQSPFRAFRYIYGSSEVKALQARRCDVGIDVLGSPFGSLLMLRARIPWRLGVRGYAGGHTAVQQSITFNPRESVARGSLRFAELLGAADLPSPKPGLFLDAKELERGREIWSRELPGLRPDALKVILSPGGGFPEKCWPLDHFAELARRMATDLGAVGLIVGSDKDRETGASIASHAGGSFLNLAGRLSLRETFSVLGQSSLALCNSSMLMHASAALDVPAFVFLGPSLESAADHSLLWGHGNITTILGRTPGRDRIWEVGESFDLIRDHCSRSRFFPSRSTGC